jgi:asparagine synthase (glutamine-hydrolysing)
MCGIIGGNNYNSSSIKDGLNKILHRGRDNSTIEQVEDFYFAHNRLSIQDLSEFANQPLWNEDKTVCIVYNGELWGSKLTDKLKSKITIPFRTTSDTEIILNSYLEFGVDSFKDLDGMFSFCIIDTRSKTAYLVRDYIGELPFWYSIDKLTNKLAFCSEKKGLPLSDIYMKSVKTVYPGTYVEYNYETLYHSVKTYYELPNEIIEHDRDTIIKNIRSLLGEAVQAKMISDVPICTLLSGGIDSVITTYLLSKLYPKLEAFVVTTEGGSDIKFARIAAKEFGIKLHEIHMTNDEIMNSIDTTLYVTELTKWQNIGSALATIKLGEEINKHGFKVVFSGDLSDEIWGSYGHIQAFHYTPETYDIARRKLIKDVHKGNFPSQNQSMMWGGTVEIRTPYSWRPFVEYSLNIPPLYQNEKGHMKPLLREAFKGEISDELLWRKKVWFAQGAGTSDGIEKIKDTLKDRLKNQFQYKDDLNIKKFWG